MNATIPFNAFHCLPGDTPHVETALEPNELITSIELPPLPFARQSRYRKVRDRASYAFALVSVAAALEIENGRIRNVRLALGGVAPKPWRAYEAEKVLWAGKPVWNFSGARPTPNSRTPGDSATTVLRLNSPDARLQAC